MVAMAIPGLPASLGRLDRLAAMGKMAAMVCLVLTASLAVMAIPAWLRRGCHGAWCRCATLTGLSSTWTCCRWSHDAETQ
jgi:hypothetical protein